MFTFNGRGLEKLLMTSLVMVSVSCSSINIDVEDNDANKEVTLSVEPKIKVKELWSIYAGPSNEQDFIKLVPSANEDIVYTVSAVGEVKAWSRDKGKKLWRVDVGEPITGGVFGGYGVVLFATSEGNVIALKSDNGEQLWRHQVLGEVLSPPQSNGRIVVVQLANGTVQGLDLKTGESQWEYTTSVPSLTLRGTSTPKIEKQMVYMGFANGKIAALDLVTGSARWEMPLHLPEGGSELERVVDVDGNILVDSQKIYAASYQGKIAALDKSTGRPRWKTNGSNFVGLEKGLGNIYSVEEDGKLIAIDANTGKQVWQQEILLGRNLSAPSVQKNYLIVGDSEGNLYWFNQSDGALLATKRLRRGPVAVFSTGHFKGLRKDIDHPNDFRVYTKSALKNGILYVQNQFGVVAAYEIDE